MTTITERRTGRDRFLLVFGEKACARRRLFACQEGECRIYFSADELMLKETISLQILQREGMYFIREERLYEDQPFYYDTFQKEKLILLLAKELIGMERTGRLLLQRNENCQIGNAYKNRVFYNCCSLVGAENANLFVVDGRYRICPQAESEGIYLNKKRLTRERELSDGDQIDIYGLHLRICGEFILCVCFAGVVRIAGEGAAFDEVYLRGISYRPCLSASEKSIVEREPATEQKLSIKEKEILAPKPRPGREETPLLLSIGPSITMVLPMFLMALVGSRLMGQGSSFYLLSLTMGVCSGVLALFWGIVNYFHKRYTEHRFEKYRIIQYHEYLRRVREELTGCVEQNRKILNSRYPTAESFLGREGRAPGVLWNRYYRQKDFLFLRLGTGTTNSRIQVKLAQQSGDIVPDRLYQEGSRLVEEFQKEESMPLGIDFFRVRQLGVEADTDKEEDFKVLFNLLIQLAACHCYTEVKVVCFYDKSRIGQKRFAECIRWLPHIWSPDKKVRFLAGDEKESGEILPALMAELDKGQRNKRTDDQTADHRKIPWYLVFVLNQELLQGESFYGCLTETEGDYPVSAIFTEKEKELFPKSCLTYLTWKCGDEIIKKEDGEISRQPVSFERIAGEKALHYFRGIAGLKVRETGMEEQIPDKVDFLGLYGCSRVEQLESAQRWEKNHPEQRLKVPIGRGMGGRIVSLDIHEKFHGPHGLIAGTTGFGKSELILTFLLSIAVNFSPEAVNFFMIDYKGGGTGNVLLGLPHCAGVISNLSGKQIKRAMSAITSENKRRQKLFSQWGVNHIDAYTQLYRENKAAEPMPHLILVVDEFAQLRKEEPEFMQEIISLSQVGRSLGIHLILATQKPAGTVDDRIWSNARFHLCLKVQDRQDSMDMLHNGDAALLTAPGQCYLQIGSHEYYELFQTGYCGQEYCSETENQSSTVLVENTGNRICLKKKRESSLVSQLETVISYVNQLADRQCRIRAKSLWMPELPEKITFTELEQIWLKERGEEAVSKNTRKESEILLGLCDDPENQRQFSFSYRPEHMGHMILCGGPQSGKTKLIQAILWQLLMQEAGKAVMILGVDMSQGSMRNFAGMPGVLGVLQDTEEKDIFFYHLDNLFQKRKEMFPENGEKMPSVFLLIDNFAAVYAVLEEKQQELILKLAREGMGYGIYLILSASSAAEIPGRIFEKVKTTLALSMSDRFAYGDILRKYSMDVLPRENTPGRGLCRQEERILEFQGVLFEEAQWVQDRIKMNRKPPKPFPHLPKPANFEIMKKEYSWRKNCIPIGYSLTTGEIRDLNLEKNPVFLISTSQKNHGKRVLEDMAQSLLIIGKKVVWVRGDGILQLHKEEAEEKCFLIADLTEFIQKINEPDEERGERLLFWEMIAGGKVKGCFLTGAYHCMQDSRLMTEPVFRELSMHQNGIHIGGNAGAQRVFSFENLGYTRLNKREADSTGYWKQGPFSMSERIFIPGISEEER